MSNRVVEIQAVLDDEIIDMVTTFDRWETAVNELMSMHGKAPSFYVRIIREDGTGVVYTANQWERQPGSISPLS